MDTPAFRECLDPTVLLVIRALLVLLVLLVPEAQLVLTDPQERMEDLALMVLLDLLVTVVPPDKVDLLVLPDLLVFLDLLVRLAADTMCLVAMMSTELTKPLSGPRTTRLMPLSSL